MVTEKTKYFLRVANPRAADRPLNGRLITIHLASPCRAGFRHGQKGQLPRAPTKRGAPTNEEPHAKADSNKGSPRQKGFNALSVVFEWGPIEWRPIK
jgi:hypothetical protein